MTGNALIVSFRPGSRETDALAEKLIGISPVPASAACLRGKPDSPVPELSSMIAESPGDTLIMPLLIQKGSAYRTMLSYGRRTGQPLLGNEADASEAAAALSEALERKDGKNYIIIAHGDMEGNTDEYRVLKSLLRDDMKLFSLRGPDTISPEAVPDAEETEIIPFLLSYGFHAERDIAEIILPELEYRMKAYIRRCSLLSLTPRFEEMMIRHFRELVTK